ncbi:unnamed protein product, partial [Meganyctiphanes norvegica]
MTDHLLLFVKTFRDKSPYKATGRKQTNSGFKKQSKGPFNKQSGKYANSPEKQHNQNRSTFQKVKISRAPRNSLKDRKRIANDMGRVPVGGRLFRFRAAWQGANHESVVRTGLSWSWKKKLPPPKRLRQKTSPSLDKILSTLRKKRVIEKAKSLRWQSRLFTVPKKDAQEDRLILDLSILNSFIHCPHFKMLTMKEVKLLLPKDYWTVSIDLKDGYWHVGISKTKR